MTDLLTLKIVTPSKEYCYENCDSVRLSINDGIKGNEGGSYGIRYGHAKALLSVAEGSISAFSNGQQILSARISSGFADVEKDSITVVAKYLEQKE